MVLIFAAEEYTGFMKIFMTYLLPILIVIFIAGLLAFLLAFLGQKFAVKRDEKIDVIKSLLAGANCGGCGYAGCDAFAEALNKGEANMNQCKPTTPENKALISNVLGIANVMEEPMVACVKCGGGHNCLDKGGYVGYGDCESVDMLSGGTKACPVGCMGLNTCSTVCGYNAVGVNRENGVSEVDFSKCVACGACVRDCPQRIISFIPKKAKVYVACSNNEPGKEVNKYCKVGCIACGICQRNCPNDAIHVIDNLAVIDYSKCTGCGICADKCPKKTIRKK